MPYGYSSKSLRETALEEFTKQLARSSVPQSTEPSRRDNLRSCPSFTDFFSNPDMIFGFEAVVCHNCFTIMPRKWLFLTNVNQWGSSSSTFSFHNCVKPRSKAEAESLNAHLDESMVSALKSWTKVWTEARPHLFSLDINDPSGRIRLRILQDGRSIALPAPKEIIEVPFEPPGVGNHYSARYEIIRQRDTSIDERLLTNFLRLVKYTTYSLFRVESPDNQKKLQLIAIMPEKFLLSEMTIAVG